MDMNGNEEEKMDIVGLTEEDFKTWEAEYQISFPQDYMQYCLAPGKALKGKQVHLQVGSWESSAIVHGVYLSKKDLNDAIEMQKESWWPKGYLPFAYDEGGEYFCISTNTEDFGVVYYFASDSIEDEPEDALIRVSACFADFLDQIS